MIKINDKEIVTVYTVNRIEILDGNISMKDKYALFPVKFYDQEGNFFAMNNVEVKGEEYDAWNSDDYIEELILSKLGMTKLVELPEVETTSDTIAPESDVTGNDSVNFETGTASEPGTNTGTASETSDPGTVA